MFNNACVAALFLRAQTPLHPGSGTSVGAIDQTIQREVHTNWPVIHSSALKGVLRDMFRRQKNVQDDDPAVAAVFGPPRTVQTGEGFAGALVMTDSRILAFPVASAKGVFLWITCNAVLERLQRDLAMMGSSNGSFQSLRAPDDKCFVTEPGEVGVTLDNTQRLLLRDMEWEIQTKPPELDTLAKWMAERIGIKTHQQPRSIFDPRARLAIVPDDDFTYLTKYATAVVSRNALDSSTRTVMKGALFSEELIPAETILYSILLAEKPRRQNAQSTEALQEACDVMQAAREVLASGTLQIGADETTGKGWCWTHLWELAEQAEEAVS